MYARLGDDTLFHMKDVLALIAKEPQLLKLTSGTGYEGLEKSLKEDETWRREQP